MKKVNILIVLAALFITGVMVSVIIQGVHLQERKMVKWSEVSDPSAAGDKLAKFLFPLAQQFTPLAILSDDPWGKEFYLAFANQSAKLSKTIRIEQSPLDTSESSAVFFLTVLPLYGKSYKAFCGRDLRDYCIALRAQKAFEKKDRETQQTWISMYRYEDNRAVLFYYSPDN